MTLERNENLEAVYEIHRKYIEHEDELVHQRTTSLITIQSFLLATFGFTFQKRYEVAATIQIKGSQVPDMKVQTSEFNGFLLILACIGVATAYIAYRSIKAAQEAIQQLAQSWETTALQEKAPSYLPGITGGGHRNSSKSGVAMTTWTPVLLMGLWLLTLFVLFFIFDVRISLKT